MSKRSVGISAEERVRRKALAIHLVSALNPNGTETHAEIEEELGLYEGKLAEMSRQATRKRRNRETGQLVESDVGGMEDWEFALVAGKGYDKGCGRLSDQFIFEFGLSQLVESVQIQSKRGPTEAKESAATRNEREQIRFLLNNRHAAQKIFANGLENVRQGEVPWTKNGRRKRWANATAEERRASFDGWLNEIEQLGCRVLERDEWERWFEGANPSGMSSTIEQFLWYWSGGSDEYPVGCPPWVWAVDVDYWGNFDALNSRECLDSLVLITESDMPYSAYHARFEQPGSNSPLQGSVITEEVTGFSVIAGTLGAEPDFQGDDIEVWLREREERAVQAAQEADALIDRASRRKSGGVRF